MNAAGLPNDPTLTATSSPSSDGTNGQFPAGTNFVAGTNVTLTATPNSGYAFASWSGSVSTTTNPLTVTVNNNMTLTANFASSSASSPFSVSLTGFLAILGKVLFL